MLCAEVRRSTPLLGDMGSIIASCENQWDFKPYTIYVGQRLRLASTGKSSKQSTKAQQTQRVAKTPARAVYKEKPVSKRSPPRSQSFVLAVAH